VAVVVAQALAWAEALVEGRLLRFVRLLAHVGQSNFQP